MILACKAYLTEDGKLSIWNESKCVMISKIKVKYEIKIYTNDFFSFFCILLSLYKLKLKVSAIISQDCIKLCETYHNCYDAVCKKFEEEKSPDEKPFEVSEMYVFGKFAAFRTRIIKVSNN